MNHFKMIKGVLVMLDNIATRLSVIDKRPLKIAKIERIKNVGIQSCLILGRPGITMTR